MKTFREVIQIKLKSTFKRQKIRLTFIYFNHKKSILLKMCTFKYLINGKKQVNRKITQSGCL